MDRIIIIAAPSCCGKSEFTRKLQAGELPEITRQLNITDISEWEYLDSYYVTNKTIHDLSSTRNKKILLHWTIAHPTLRVALRNFFLRIKYEKKVRIDLINSASSVTLVTLQADPQVLLQRVGKRRDKIYELHRNKVTSKIHFWRQLQAVNSLSAFFGDLNSIEKLYSNWYAFCDTLCIANRLLVDVSDVPKLVASPIHILLDEQK